MPKMEPKQKIFAIVILGDFNPAIFHPSWLAQNELIPNEEVGDASDRNQEVMVVPVHYSQCRRPWSRTSSINLSSRLFKDCRSIEQYVDERAT